MPTPDVEIRSFRPEDSSAFRDLNEAWINRYFGLEEHDRLILGDPEGHILKPGGHIFMALAQDKPIGCCALIPLRPGVFELAKMAVAEECRGRGIGRKILAHTIAQAKALGSKSVYLETNTRLADAIHLYEALGFRRLAPERITPSPYVRADVFMEMDL